jgi:hypothetical protein
MAAESTKSESATAEIVDEARSAASGLRSTTRWIVSALAAVPSIGIVGTMVAGPGDRGYDSSYLYPGVLLAAGGALLALLWFADVLRPVPLKASDLRDSDVALVPGSPFTTVTKLNEGVETARDAVADAERDSRQAEEAAKAAEARVAVAEPRAKEAEEEAKTSKDKAVKDRAIALRREADRLAGEKTVTAAAAARERVQLDFEREQFKRHLKIREEALLLRAGTIVGDRFKSATQRALPISALMLAFGLIFLAQAPRPKAEEAAAPLKLLHLTLSEDGKDALGCELDALDALQIGGDEKTPRVITLPTDTCASKVVEFRTADKPVLGEAEVVEAVDSNE